MNNVRPREAINTVILACTNHENERTHAHAIIINPGGVCITFVWSHVILQDEIQHWSAVITQTLLLSLNLTTMLTRCVIFRVHAYVPDGGGGLMCNNLLSFPSQGSIRRLCYFCSRLKELFVPDWFIMTGESRKRPKDLQPSWPRAAGASVGRYFSEGRSWIWI